MNKLLITKKWILAGGLICAAITNLNAATVPVISLADDGTAGTLREALAAANDGDTIDATGISGTITLLPQLLTSSQLGITKSVTILGPGPANLTIDGNGTSRVFRTFPGLTVVIEGLTIANGLASGAPPGSFPPSSGGGIYNDHTILTVRKCVLTGNEADEDGGAIYNDGTSSDSSTLTVEDSILSGNSAGIRGGGICNDGAGPGSSATLAVIASTLSGNSAIGGGGICNDGSSGGSLAPSPSDSGSATLTVIASTLSNNSAFAGGGIRNSAFSFGNATVTVVASTLSGNLAKSLSGEGGGIGSEGNLSGRATVNVSISTLSGNSAGSLGGGIFNDSSALQISASTLSGNSARLGGGIFIATGQDPATLDIGNTILKAGGSDETIFNDGGTVTSHGFNLSSDNGVTNSNGGTGDLNATGDQILTDPMLGPLANNGGPTLTHLPLPGSPAIDQGSSDALVVLGITTDQRGSARTVDDLNIANAFLGDGTDIGAVESAAPNGSPVASCRNVTVLAGSGGTASASIDDGSSDPDGDAVTLVQDPPGPYPIGTTLVTLTVTDTHGASSSCTSSVTVQGVTDLLLSLGVDKTNVKQGDLLTYTITIKNFGPNEALNLVINDNMSGGTTFVSARANKGHFTAPPVNQTGTVTWNLANLPSGEAEGAQLVVKVLIKGKTTVTNSASVTSATSDPNTQNNSASITTTVGAGGSGNSGGGKKTS